MIVCVLTAQAGDLYTTGCGRQYKSSEMPEEVTGWSSEVTCPLCATRVLFHQKVENFNEMTLLIDLGNPEVAKPFHFSTKRFRFKWVVGGRLVYVYNSELDYSPMLAIGIAYPDEPTYENAQVLAKLWILEKEDHFAVTGAPRGAVSVSGGGYKRARKSAPPKPIVPPGYDGLLCSTCGKIDEGDFMPSPTNMLEQVCMTCLVKGSK